MSHIGGQVITRTLELPQDLDKGNVVELQRITRIVESWNSMTVKCTYHLHEDHHHVHVLIWMPVARPDHGLSRRASQRSTRTSNHEIVHIPMPGTRCHGKPANDLSLTVHLGGSHAFYTFLMWSSLTPSMILRALFALLSGS